VPHEPILTAVGSTLHRKTWHPSLPARGRAARMSERDRDRTLKPRRINVAQVPQTDVGILGKGGPDRPHCTWPKRLPALKSGNGVRGHLCGAGQITHAPSQCSAGHSALYRQQFVILLRLLLLIAGHVSIVPLF
jgi:hypothetical protein